MLSGTFLHFKPKILPKIPTYLARRKLTSPVDLSHTIHGSEITANVAPFIVLHGLLGSKKNWASVSKVLAEKTGRSVVAVDLRNHGDSPHATSHTYKDLASDVELLMYNLRIKKTILIGHSMGGRTSMVLSLTKPEKVACLIVVDITPTPSTRALSSNFFPNLLEAMRNVKFDKEVSIIEARNTAKKYLNKLIDNEETLNFIVLNLAKDTKENVAWRINVDSLKEFYRSDIAGFPQDLDDKKYTGPTLFIAGGQSDFVQKSDHHILKKYFPSSSIQTISSAGHNVHADSPKEFVDAVLRFLEQNKGKII